MECDSGVGDSLSLSPGQSKRPGVCSHSTTPGAVPIYSPERLVQTLLQRALWTCLKFVQGICHRAVPENCLPAVPGLGGMKGMEWERGREGQNMKVLSLGKEAHARDKSGEAGGPAIAPCTVIAVEKGEREAGQEKYEGDL